MALRLTSRIVLLFVAVAAVLVATVGTLAYRSGRASLEAAALSELVTSAIEKQAALETWVEERLGNLRQLGREPDLVAKAAALVAAASASGDRASARALVLEEVEPYVSAPDARFIEMFVIDADRGTVIASTSPA